MDDDVVAGDPVHGGGDLVLVAGLQGVDDTEDLGRVAAGGGGVRQDGADGLLGVDDEDGADGEGDALLVDVGGVLVVKPVRVLSATSVIDKSGEGSRKGIHVVEESNLPLLVRDDGEVERVAADLLDVGGPALVAVDRVGTQAEQLDTALGELRLEAGHLAQLGSAHGGVVLRV